MITAGARLFLSPPHMSGREEQYVAEAFASNYVAPIGPQIDAFEKAFSDYTGIAHCVALSSGTAALHLALRYLDVKQREEIWASDLTFIGSVAPIFYEKAVPVFFDCDETWTLDPGLLADQLARAAKINRLPKAVIPTDLYGQSCNLDAIVEACNRYDVPVIADSAEAMGTLYKGRHAGKGAFAAAYSFNGNKIITTSGGGMLASDDRALIDRARYLSQAARQPVPHYEHTEIGYNYRLSNISAAIGRGQLEVLNERVKRRREIFARYQTNLSVKEAFSFMPEASYGQSSRWLTILLIDPKKTGVTGEGIRLALEKDNIEARAVWKPMHMQPVFKDARFLGHGNSEVFYKIGLCLPSGSQMTDADIDRVSNKILSLNL